MLTLFYLQYRLYAAFAFSSSSGVLVRSCNAWIPPSAAISSLSNPYTIRCLAGCIFDLNASETMLTLLPLSLCTMLLLARKVCTVPEMGFPGSATSHGLVVRVLV